MEQQQFATLPLLPNEELKASVHVGRGWQIVAEPLADKICTSVAKSSIERRKLSCGYAVLLCGHTTSDLGCSLTNHSEHL